MRVSVCASWGCDVAGVPKGKIKNKKWKRDCEMTTIKRNNKT